MEIESFKLNTDEVANFIFEITFGTGNELHLNWETITAWAKASEVLEDVYDWVDIKGEHQQSKLYPESAGDYEAHMETFFESDISYQQVEDLVKWTIKTDKL